MNFKKQHIAFIIFVALIFGGIGLFAGMQINQATLEQPQTLNNDKNGEQIENENENDNIDEEIEGLDKVSKAFSLIKENYLEEIDDKELIEGAIHGMLDTLEDPYSAYMDDQQTEQFNEEIESSFEGIGAEVSMVNGKVTIVAPIKDSPAEEAGLRPNDQILKIDNESIEGRSEERRVGKECRTGWWEWEERQKREQVVDA